MSVLKLWNNPRFQSNFNLKLLIFDEDLKVLGKQHYKKDNMLSAQCENYVRGVKKCDQGTL